MRLGVDFGPAPDDPAVRLGTGLASTFSIGWLDVSLERVLGRLAEACFGV
jgi:hypothetical protein